MVYINSRGEVIDDNKLTATNFFWKFVTFVIMFFKTLIGIEDASGKKNNSNVKGPGSSGGGFFGGGGGRGDGNGGGGGPSKDTKKFGPRGFKSITDLRSPPSMGCSPCGMGGCG